MAVEWRVCLGKLGDIHNHIGMSPASGAAQDQQPHVAWAGHRNPHE